MFGYTMSVLVPEGFKLLIMKRHDLRFAFPVYEVAPKIGFPECMIQGGVGIAYTVICR